LNRSDDQHRLLPRFRRQVPEIKNGSANGNGNGHKVIASAGDAEIRDLRMLPVIAIGVAGEIPFTRPDREAVRRLSKQGR
jgi:hypothetical protein